MYLMMNDFTVIILFIDLTTKVTNSNNTKNKYHNIIEYILIANIKVVYYKYIFMLTKMVLM